MAKMRVVVPAVSAMAAPASGVETPAGTLDEWLDGIVQSGQDDSIHIRVLNEIIHAAYRSNRVVSKFDERGGVLFIAPPGHLKTTILQRLEGLEGVMLCSDLTSRGLVAARDAINNGKVHCFAFLDMQKIYERNQDTAENIIGNLRALVAEGFTTAAFEEQQSNPMVRKAKALVLGAATPDLYNKKVVGWTNTGMARRFLFSHFALSDPNELIDATLEQQPIELEDAFISMPLRSGIETVRLRDSEIAFLRLVMGWQADTVPSIFLQRVLAVLKWKFERLGGDPREPYRILWEFGKTLKTPNVKVRLLR